MNEPKNNISMKLTIHIIRTGDQWRKKRLQNLNKFKNIIYLYGQSTNYERARTKRFKKKKSAGL